MTDATVVRNGEFVWREIMTKDVAMSRRFYGEVLGWKTETMKMPDGNDYTMIKVGDRGIGGMMKLPMAEVPSHWAAYVSVADVDATVKVATGAGGKVVAGPMDAGGIGRFAYLQDPQGAMICAWKSNSGDGERIEQPGVGEFCWESLMTTDNAAAIAFYAKVFGWSHKPMEASKDIEVFSAGKTQVASFGAPPPPGAPPHWLSYVVVDKLDSTHARVKAQGGKVIVDKMAVPTVGNIAVIQDNAGAMLGLFEAPSA